MTRRRFLFILVPVLLASVVHAWAGDKLRIATEGEYPPFSYVAEKGELAGFDVDIARELCKAMNAECEIVAVKWDVILTDLAAGKYDAVVASVTKTPEREKLVDFTDKYYRTTSSFIGRNGSDIAISPEGLQGKIVATQRGTVHAVYLEKNYSGIAVVHLTDTLDGAFELLAKGEADLVLGNSLVCLGFLKRNEGKPFDFVGEALSAENLSSTANIAIRKGNDKLRNAFNRALQTIRYQGIYDKINSKYFPFSIY